MTSKPLVFISHDSRDQLLAEALAELLKAASCGMIRLFRSSDRSGSEGIGYGGDWYDSLAEKLNEASALVCLLTKRSMNRPWILYEAGWVKGHGTAKVYGIALGITTEEVSNGPFGQFQNCNDDPESLANLVVQITLQCLPYSEPDRETIADLTTKFSAKAREIVDTTDSEFPNLSGNWNYEVLTPEGERSHSGICKIVQKGSFLKLDGYRKRYRKRLGDSITEVATHNHWHSTWCQICCDGKIRVDYIIALEDVKVSAVCVLDISEDGRELTGDYFLLPPFSDTTLNAKHGSITFSKASS